ncbi:UDP-glucose 4-epimerase GalE [Prochlorococcus sp. MIT 1300]|uniref:UDP-glucose 4-epimerase GalE n=1 Tax=Prochlorococcus sp. MIT 1300 TaxID=3096218 RepID=UPI002A761044|nr:UDP-glucose 4-epimerase GalE [Prochlorococcus sp. MIT 1300]
MAQLLITGGAGFIGSHTCLVLLEAGHNLVLIENFSNSSPEALRRVLELAGPKAKSRIQIVEGDIRNSDDLDCAFSIASSPIEAVVHFAGLKAVAESFEDPLDYWDVNLGGSRSLLNAMRIHGCRTIVFSSSATIYGYPNEVPISENALVSPINPYGQTKAAVEQLLADVAASEPGWKIARLRYFNPVGAHPSGLLGEAPHGTPANLFPYVSQVAVGRRDKVEIFGGDWPTSDGSAVRDYIHVMDLAEGHSAALNVLQQEAPQVLTLNLGSGRGYSVLEVVKAFEKASQKKLPYIITSRRKGDVACSVADPDLALKRLGWSTRRGLEDMCKDSWTWQMANPDGYSVEIQSLI